MKGGVGFRFPVFGVRYLGRPMGFRLALKKALDQVYYYFSDLCLARVPWRLAIDSRALARVARVWSRLTMMRQFMTRRVQWYQKEQTRKGEICTQ